MQLFKNTWLRQKGVDPACIPHNRQSWKRHLYRTCTPRPDEEWRSGSGHRGEANGFLSILRDSMLISPVLEMLSVLCG